MYARMVTSYVKPNKLDELTAVCRDKLLPLIEHQPGFNGLFIMNDPLANKEVTLTFWERIVDMEAFNVNLLALKDAILPLLAQAPEVEIFEVMVPEEVSLGHAVAFSETSVGVLAGSASELLGYRR
jgi:hypothetical protein